jgi:hypothetical protein
MTSVRKQTIATQITIATSMFVLKSTPVTGPIPAPPIDVRYATSAQLIPAAVILAPGRRIHAGPTRAMSIPVMLTPARRMTGAPGPTGATMRMWIAAQAIFPAFSKTGVSRNKCNNIESEIQERDGVI